MFLGRITRSLHAQPRTAKNTDMTLELLTDTEQLQIVDGNNLVLERLFRGVEASTGIRPLLREIAACRQPPIIVFDGPHARRRRLEIMPGYKAGRPVKDTYTDSILPSLALVRELLPFTPAVVVCVSGWEADDVVATLARRSAAQGQRVRVVSNDKDFAQLADHPLIEVTAEVSGVPAAQVHAYKTAVGDTSDNVKGIKGFGEKTWAKCDSAALTQFLEQYEGWVPSTGLPRELGLPLAVQDWWRAYPETVQACWKVTALWDVPADDLLGSVKSGSHRPDIIDTILNQYML